MSYSTIRVLLPSACLLAWTVAGCGSDGARAFGGDGTGGHLVGNTGGTPGDDGGAAGEPGTGGMPDGTGGVPGSGGATGTGGIRGTGGGSAASGGRGTGGRTGFGGAGNIGGGAGFKGTGGVLGSGGHPGTGGAPASGGNSGSGGGGGPDPAKCNQLEADYLKEMPNAKMCTIGTSVPQCQMMIAASLGCSCGNTYVQTVTTLKEIASKWTSEGCGSINRICPAIACILPQSSTCAASTAGTPPQCQNGPIAFP